MEKERYKYGVCGFKKIYFDNETHTTIDVLKTLNQQDKRIKELEKQIEKERTLTMNLYLKALYQIDDLREENQQLKEKYDNLYKCYQKTSQEDLKDKYDLAEENEELKAENKRLKEKIC